MYRGLQHGDTVGFIACSDGRKIENQASIDAIQDVLATFGIRVKLANTLFCQDGTPFSGAPQARGKALMDLFADDQVKAIFDISGGDAANQILPYLDYAFIRKHDKPFFGISDLSVILNALYSCSRIVTYHFEIMYLIGEHELQQRQRFKTLLCDQWNNYDPFITFQYDWLRGSAMQGVVVGGNIRCFLKLAGTRYMPDPTNKILFLESLGGGATRMASLLAQLEQIGYFERCKGVLLGTFTELEAQKSVPTIEELVLGITQKYGLPVAKTNELGHGADAHCLPVGAHLSFRSSL